ncbi:hypothetical protein QYE76_031513 [Lolium multiflorum]|uniref:Transposase (putative) gypsy type domain-containing protein n=1 Tax=Lolium multiflorum TaxID=4521 RepID=A0AAD8QT07_LOLMU|nr:hypothetical protein QYE76_031513 [Lolium multiflorum]
MPPARYRGSLLLPLAAAPSLSQFLRALFARHCFISGDLLASLGDRSRPELSAVRQPSARQAGATGPRGSTLRSSPPRSPPVRSGSSSPFDLNWSSSSSSSSMASASGSWRGSLMNDDDIERLVRLRRIPREVVTRAPGDEVEPRPDPGERVVFGAHLDRGLGLPASAFFRRFLDFFGLQPHHLPANACVLLSCYVAFMEGYAGLWPDVGPGAGSSTSSRKYRLRAAIFPRQELEDGDLAHKIWTADLVDPADQVGDQAGDQAGDDDLPVVPDQGGQGEHNPPPSPEQQEEEEAEPATSTTGPGPIRAVPLRSRPPAASATSAPKKKRAAGGNTARLEGKAKRQRQQEPKKVPEMAGAAIKFAQGGSSGPAARVAPPFRRQREPTPPPTTRARTPPVVVVPPVVTPPAASPPPAGASSSAAPPSAPRRGAQGESAQGPTLGDLFPHRAPLLGPAAGAGRDVPPAAGTGAGGAAPPEGPEVVPTGPAAPPPASEPPRAEPQQEEPARARDADSRALVKAKGPAVSPTGLHVAKGARLPGTAPLKMLYSGYRASLKSKATEALAQLKTLEDADKEVEERRTVLYNKVVTSYHKAKLERATLARELEAAKVAAARVPQLEEDLRVARAQCAESEEAGRAAAAKLKVADGELRRLRALEKNHLAELTSLRAAEKEKVDDLSRRLDEVEKQRLALQQEVTDKSRELTATAKHWTDLIGAIDTGFSAAFPETQDMALDAVGAAREARGRATGEGSSATFTMEDHLSSLAARVEPITTFGWELRKAAEELVPMLWPDKEAPQNISSLASLIEQAPDRFIDWKGSATRAGADMALSFVLSWYNEVDLGQLEYRRAGVEEELSADQKAARLARASAIADFVDKRLFVADPNPHSDEEEELEDEGAEMDSPPPAVDPTGPAPAGV